MGKMEDIVVEYLSDPNVFAALFNGYVFDGEPVIHAEDLREVDGRSRLQIRSQGEKSTYEVLKKERDIVREVTIGESTLRLAILGIEHQSEIDHSMVLRTLAYDTLEYLKQAKAIEQKHRKNKDVRGKDFLSKFTVEDRLTPTITLIFYTGREKWDAARELTGLFPDSEYTKKMLPFLGNWTLNVISVYDVEHTEKYTGSLRQVFDLLKYVDDGKGMLSFVEQHDEKYTHLDKAAMRLLSELIDLELPEKAEREEEVEEGMCKALEDIRALGREEGIAQEIVEFAKELDWSTEQTLQRLQEKLHISPEAAWEYLNQYQ